MCGSVSPSVKYSGHMIADLVSSRAVGVGKLLQNRFWAFQVLFALHQKGVPFRQYEINVVEGEQFSDWYLDLNPSGEVPLLKNGSLLVPGSAGIINYVEKNCTGGELLNTFGKQTINIHAYRLDPGALPPERR